MPTYQYECAACQHSFEILQSMTEEKLKKCPACGRETLQRLIGPGSGIIFKGSGFYATDYQKKSGPANTKPACDSGGKDTHSGHGKGCGCS